MKKFDSLYDLGNFLDDGVKFHTSETSPGLTFSSTCSPQDFLDCVDDCVNSGATVAEIVSIIVNCFFVRK